VTPSILSAVTRSMAARQARRQIKGALAAAAERGE